VPTLYLRVHLERTTLYFQIRYLFDLVAHRVVGHNTELTQPLIDTNKYLTVREACGVSQRVDPPPYLCTFSIALGSEDDMLLGLCIYKFEEEILVGANST
jgi:hypothetical protein